MPRLRTDVDGVTRSLLILLMLLAIGATHNLGRRHFLLYRSGIRDRSSERDVLISV